MNKTKSEILRKHITSSFARVSTCENEIYNAMDEWAKAYAQQSPVTGYSHQQMEDAISKAYRYGLTKSATLQETLDHILSTPPVQTGWISVEDDIKPTPFVSVLIIWEKESKGMRPIQSTGMWDGESFITHRNRPVLTNKITHWMPLPEPPKQ